jgi:hypothetical protein
MAFIKFGNIPPKVVVTANYREKCAHLWALAAAAVFSDCLAFTFPTLLLYDALDFASSELSEGVETEDVLRFELAAVDDLNAAVVAGEAMA